MQYLVRIADAKRSPDYFSRPLWGASDGKGSWNDMETPDGAGWYFENNSALNMRWTRSACGAAKVVRTMLKHRQREIPQCKSVEVVAHLATELPFYQRQNTQPDSQPITLKVKDAELADGKFAVPA